MVKVDHLSHMFFFGLFSYCLFCWSLQEVPLKRARVDQLSHSAPSVSSTTPQIGDEGADLS